MTTRPCRSCGKPVRFVPSVKTGRPMILDATPQKRIVLVDDAYGRLADGFKAPELTAAQIVDTYVDHHATCPAAADWKGRRR